MRRARARLAFAFVTKTVSDKTYLFVRQQVPNIRFFVNANRSVFKKSLSVFYYCILVNSVECNFNKSSFLFK